MNNEGGTDNKEDLFRKKEMAPIPFCKIAKDHHKLYHHAEIAGQSLPEWRKLQLSIFTTKEK